jgi:general secretion pathway protein D
MRFLIFFFKTKVLIASLVLISLLWCPLSVFAARVAGSDDPVATVSPATPPQKEIAPKPDSARQETPAVDRDRKTTLGTQPTPAIPEKAVNPVAEKIPPPGSSLPETQITPKKEILPAPPALKAEDNAAQPTARSSIAIESRKGPTAEKYVTIDFDNVDITVFVKFVSELTGKNFIIDEKVKGKVTILSPKKIPVSDVYKIFLSVLEVNGFTTVAVGDMIKVIPATAAREKFMETRLKKETIEPEDRIVTQIITLERANPDEIKRVLDPIISRSSSVLSYPPAGILVITDFLSNIKRLQEIVAALDVEGAGDQISYIPLKNASATEVVKSLTTIFQQRRPTLTPIRAVSDSRTNSIILLCSVADTENMRRLIDLMDKDIPRSDSNIQVYRLQNSNSEDLVKVLTNITKDTKAATDPLKAAQAIVGKNVQIVSDKATNTLVIMAERDDYKILEGIIKKLDVPRPMVYIEALIMEVNTTKDFKIGVEWRGIKDTGSMTGVDSGQTVGIIGSGGAGSASNPGGYNILGALTNTVFPGGFTMGIIGAGIKIGGISFPNIGAVVQAYKQDQDVSILSTPQIMTIDNEEAEINVGSNVPYITRQDTTTQSSQYPVNYSSYEYRDVGVILNITPHINEENYVRLKISQQVTKVTSGTSATPTTLKRTAKTTVIIKDRETVVIGGLVGDATDEGTYKVPFLGDIPVLGWLFKSKSTSREKTNLYVFLTPYIVRTQQDAQILFDGKKETMGSVVEGVIKLDEKKTEPKPQKADEPSGENTPVKSGD